jgi:guanylate kinase
MAKIPPPILSEEARAAASQAGVLARQIRSEVKRSIAQGELSIFQAINDPRVSVQKMRVYELLSSVPGIGQKRAESLMAKIGIAASRRIAGLGEKQLLALRKELLVSKNSTQEGSLIVMSGPGGVGKSTITALLRDHPSFWVSISATTRAPRENERDSHDYYFLTDEKFDEMIRNGEFLEWAEFAGARYGTPKGPVNQWRDLGKHVLLEIEIAGARQVRSADDKAILVFIAPPSWDELVARLTSRGTDSPERREARLALAREEMAASVEFDHILVNSQVEEVAAQLLSLATSPKKRD